MCYESRAACLARLLNSPQPHSSRPRSTTWYRRPWLPYRTSSVCIQSSMSRSSPSSARTLTCWMSPRPGPARSGSSGSAPRGSTMRTTWWSRSQEDPIRRQPGGVVRGQLEKKIARFSCSSHQHNCILCCQIQCLMILYNHLHKMEKAAKQADVYIAPNQSSLEYIPTLYTFFDDCNGSDRYKDTWVQRYRRHCPRTPCWESPLHTGP